MGIKIRIILMIVGVMALVALSTNFLSNTLNTETFFTITERSLDNKFRLIEKEFEYNIVSAREEILKISSSISIGYNNIRNADSEYINNYFKDFLSASVNESQLYFNRMIDILIHPSAITNANAAYTMYRYSTIDNQYSYINIDTNEIIYSYLSTNYNVESRRILSHRLLTPFINNENNNITLNIPSAISDINNNRIIGIANVGIIFNYSIDYIKDIFNIEGSELLVIDKSKKIVIENGNVKGESYGRK